MAPLTAVAVPSLGVGTGNGYICDSQDAGDGKCPDDYQTYDFDGDGFDNTSYVGPFFGAQEGFILGPSGDNLHIWTNILDADIWLLTDAIVQSMNSPTIDGMVLSLLGDTGQFDGYKPQPYSGINLGPVFSDNVLNVGWELMPNDPFSPSPFYMYTAQLDYVGKILADHYFFAVADDNDAAGLQANNGQNNGRNGGDSFSPKTTSAVAISEPGPLAVLGAGLLLVGAIRRRRMLA
jgi:hypothetical protein